MARKKRQAPDAPSLIIPTTEDLSYAGSLMKPSVPLTEDKSGKPSSPRLFIIML